MTPRRMPEWPWPAARVSYGLRSEGTGESLPRPGPGRRECQGLGPQQGSSSTIFGAMDSRGTSRFLPRGLFRLISPLPGAPQTVHEPFDRAADEQDQKDQGHRNECRAPCADPADDAEARGEPDAGRGGEPVNARVLGVVAHDHAGTQKADAGDQALDD